MEVYFLSAEENQKIDFNGGIYGIADMDVFKHEFSYNSDNGKITEFKREISAYELEINVSAGKGRSWEENYHYMQDIFDRDTINNKRGRLYVNGYYLLCNVCEEEPEETFRNWCDFQNCILKVVTDYSYWIREHPHTFKASEITSTGNKGYPGRYPYRYASGLNNTRIVNEHYAESAFILRIYGPCVKPSVYIGGYEYHVDIVLYAGEYLEIDSTAETVTKVMVSGLRVNAFHCRSFKNSVFRPIQPGAQDIFWDGSFDFDLILLEERSEPKWS